MGPTKQHTADRRVEESMLDPRVLDPGQDLVSFAQYSEEEMAQILRVLGSIRRWRDAEQRISFESREHMKLGENDMKALRFLVTQKNQGVVVTPGALSDHLGISTASTTKLLDRLERAGHVERSPHPSDRRALAITIAERTHRSVHETVGRRHAGRFNAAARLAPAEREVVISFLESLAVSDAESNVVNDESAPADR